MNSYLQTIYIFLIRIMCQQIYSNISYLFPFNLVPFFNFYKNQMQNVHITKYNIFHHKLSCLNLSNAINSNIVILQKF